jgi:hypothetical protein
VTRPAIVAALLLAVAAICIVLLASGASYLELPLPGGLPIGNALSAIGPCAAAGTAVVLSPRGTARRFVSIASLLGAAAWLPVSIALAGNLALNFPSGRGDVWLAFSAVVAALVLLALGWALVAALLARRRHAGAA